MTNTNLLQVPFSIIADDLSGACDCGIELIHTTPRVTVHVTTDSFGSDEPDDGTCVVINTESRDMSGEDSAHHVRTACDRVAKIGNQVILKKCDSAFRGNYLRELAAAIEVFKPKVTVVCPAIPDYGRTTIDGIQRIDGIPIDEGFYANDPKHPALTSDAVELLKQIDGVSVSHIPIDDLRGGRGSPEGPANPESPVVVLDGETNADLDRSAALFWPGHPGSCVDASARVLFVGGQGIAAAIARLMPENRSGSVDDEPPAEGSAMVVAASLHPATREQLQLLEQAQHVHPVTIPADGIDAPGKRRETLRALLAQADSGGLIVMDTSRDDRGEPETVEAVVAGICGDVLTERPVRAIMLTGGSTAFSVCRHLGIDRLVLRDRIAAGAVLSRPQPDRVQMICVKGGSLGEPDTMVRFARAV